MKNKYISLIKDTLIFALGTIGSKIILFILVPLYTNCLTPSEYGIADLVFSMAQLLIPFACLGVYYAILRFGLEKKENADDALFSGIIVASVGAFIVICLTPLLSFYKTLSDWKWYFCVYLILHLYLSIFQNYAKAIGKNKTYAIISIAYTAVLALLNIFFLLYEKRGIHGYLIANVLATIFAAMAYIFTCKIFFIHKIAKFNGYLLKKMLIYSLPLMIDGIIWWFIQSSNKLFIEFFLNSEILGLYTVAIKIPSLMYVVVTIFSQAWGISTIKEIDKENDALFYKNVFSVYSVLIVLICMGIILIIKPFMNFYVHESYFSSWKFIPLLLVSNAFLAISDFFGAFYNALKKTVNNMLISLLAAVLSVLFSLLFLNIIGLWAAILATFLAYFTIMCIRMLNIRKYVQIKINFWKFIFNLLILMTYSVLIILEFNTYVVSIVFFILFFIINLKIIFEVLTITTKYVKSRIFNKK
ncbi:MAG: oligosaccharide flippase family protein [Bacilli bacterium]|nr:oligosaccharide flippase family protein [Bacilli bacterium]